MSSANLFVRFPDGTIRYGVYHGTSDVCIPALFDTPEAFRERDGTKDWDYEPGTGEPVVVATDYGNGSHWPATATPTHLTSNLAPWDDCPDFERDGLPDWAPEWAKEWCREAGE